MIQHNLAIRRVVTCNGVRYVARMLGHYSRGILTRPAYTFSVTPRLTREEAIMEFEQRLHQRTREIA